MDCNPSLNQRVETFSERAIRLLQEKAVREGKRKFSNQDIVSDPLLPHPHLLKGSFKTLQDYVRAAGLYPAFHPNKDDLIRSLKEFKEVYKRSPRTSDAGAGMLVYSRTLYEKKFGSWNKALEAAGLETVKAVGGRKKSLSDEAAVKQAVAEIRELYGETGILPTVADHNSNSNAPHKANYYIRRVGAWAKLAELARLKMAGRKRPATQQQDRTAAPAQSTDDHQNGGRFSALLMIRLLLFLSLVFDYAWQRNLRRR